MLTEKNLNKEKELIPIVISDLLLNHFQIHNKPWNISAYSGEKLVSPETTYFPPKYEYGVGEIEGDGECWDFLGWTHCIRSTREVSINNHHCENLSAALSEALLECLIVMERLLIQNTTKIITGGEEDIMLSVRACFPQKIPIIHSLHEVRHRRFVLTTGEAQQFEFTMTVADFGWDICAWLECLVGVHAYRPKN